MKRKHKILMTMTAILFLLLSAIPADTKGMKRQQSGILHGKELGKNHFFEAAW